MKGIRLFRPYFAHPINLYNTQLERSLHLLIAHHFNLPERAVENPNQPHHQEGYVQYARRASLVIMNHEGMGYFFDEVLPDCDGSVAIPFFDGCMGFGVAGEMNWFIKEGLPVFVIFATEEVAPEALHRFELDHHSGLFDLRPFTEEEKIFIMANDPRLVVPHEETRLRTFFVYGQTMRPFEESHLVRLPVPSGFYPDKK
ncbi:MAG: hypothetical protein Q8L52_00375 [bacterium]|nr:hypothetical protein [bacterium]